MAFRHHANRNIDTLVERRPDSRKEHLAEQPILPVNPLSRTYPTNPLSRRTKFLQIARLMVGLEVVHTNRKVRRRARQAGAESSQPAVIVHKP